MLEFFQFIFSSFWIFLGFVIILAIVCDMIRDIFRAIFSKHNQDDLIEDAEKAVKRLTEK